MAQSVELTWVGGEHEFSIDIGGLRAIQDVCHAGPMQILTALSTGLWRVDYPLAVLRHGLIGGGMPAADAKALVSSMADQHPIADFVTPAHAVLSAAVLGVPDDPVGEPEGAMSPPEN